MQELQSILSDIESGVLLSQEFFDSDFEEALDKRDAEPFDAEWMRVHRTLNDIPISAEQKRLLAEIRKGAFLAAMEAAESSDLAGYIADDFDLLGRGIIANAADPWLNSLWAHYREGSFPCGELNAVQGNLRVLVSEIAPDS